MMAAKKISPAKPVAKPKAMTKTATKAVTKSKAPVKVSPPVKASLTVETVSKPEKKQPPAKAVKKVSVAKPSPVTKEPPVARPVKPVVKSKSAPKTSWPVKPIVGISTDKGVLVAVSVPTDAAPLTEFRLAVKEPFPRAVNAPKSKCRQTMAIIHDESSKTDLTVYLAFIPVPARFPIIGSVLYRAKFQKGEETFFNAGTQVLEKIEGKQLARILMVLEQLFADLLPDVFGAEHALTQAFDKLVEKKRETEFWNATQTKVSDLLKSNKGKEALAVLEPLVFQRTPHQQAEKLLGELLWRASTKNNPDQANDDALKQVVTERLLFEYLLRNAGVSPVAG